MERLCRCATHECQKARGSSCNEARRWTTGFHLDRPAGPAGAVAKRAARRHPGDEIRLRQTERDLVGRSEEDGQRSPRPAYGHGSHGDDASATFLRTKGTGADGSGHGYGQKIDPVGLDQAAAFAADPRGNPARANPPYSASPGISDFRISRTATSFSISMPVLNPLLSHRNTRSSNTTFPVAPGANGQPPRPPSDPSSTRAPASSAAEALAMPMPLVSCR